MRLALRYLGYRSRSEAEVRQYLRRHGCAPALADPTIERLRSLNYLNDENFALHWALGRAQAQSYGPRRIEQELRQKGVGLPLIRKAIRQVFDEVDETRQAKRLLDRHFQATNLQDPKAKQRAVAFLLRRGFGSNVVFNLLGYRVEEDMES